MAIRNHNEQSQYSEQVPSLLLDALYCSEEQWEDNDIEEVEEIVDGENGAYTKNDDNNKYYQNYEDNPSLLPYLFLEQDLFWEDEELLSLFAKEQQQQGACVRVDNTRSDSSVSAARSEAVNWILKVNAHHGFSALTATLAINYFDRFRMSLYFQGDEPWTIQLVAVACLSLAAKVEETQVPLLLDLQVEGTKFVFEAKTIQRMELLVLSTLKWEMHPVTPLSFLDHIVRRLGLRNNIHWVFLHRCEHLLLSALSDSRFICYFPSVLATATMMYVIDQIEETGGVDYKNQLLSVLNISKEKVNDCYNLILELSKVKYSSQCNKRKRRRYDEIPGSPSGVIDAAFSSDSSNDSWTVESLIYLSPQPPLFKKGRIQEQQMKLSPLNREIV